MTLADRSRFVVGLTGGIGCGKSTVASILGGMGAVVLDADAVVHDLYLPGRDGASAVAEILGPEVLDSSGGVDRERLAARVFSDEELRRRLEERVHPLVMAAVDSWLPAVPSELLPVVEAALLFESGHHLRFASLVVVACSDRVQRARLAARHPEWSAEEMERRIASQMSIEAKARLATHVIWNDGTVAELERSCLAVYRDLMRDKAEWEAPRP